jgi:hypothetical protein
MGDIQARLIQEIGTRAWLRVYTYGPGLECPVNKTYGCDASVVLGDVMTKDDRFFGGSPSDHSDHLWPKTCGACKGPLPGGATRQILRKPLFNTASGAPERGDLFWRSGEHWESEFTAYGQVGQARPCKPTRCHHRWTNCDGNHLYAILPDGTEWCVYGRASNCTLQDDQEHRCWVTTGELPNITACKNGYTCSAGAGSIASTSGWHGFLVNGVFQRTP